MEPDHDEDRFGFGDITHFLGFQPSGHSKQVWVRSLEADGITYTAEVRLDPERRIVTCEAKAGADQVFALKVEGGPDDSFRATRFEITGRPVSVADDRSINFAAAYMHELRFQSESGHEPVLAPPLAELLLSFLGLSLPIVGYM